jgi:antibiotic biosynthesis monooxygenase (ABM) superfamily enzyme
MALLTFLGLIVPVHFIPTALQALLPQHQLLALSASVALMVGLMSYFITPLMTRVAAGRLYR